VPPAALRISQILPDVLSAIECFCDSGLHGVFALLFQQLTKR
jgi:hypothetical protein